MNRLNFNQSVGFPFETNILDEMQKAYALFNALGYISGNFSIISGCELVGTTVSNGVVFINGEVLNFVGGEVQDKVIIVESIEALEFEDLNTRDVIYTRHATFGTAVVQWDWADFKRGVPTNEVQDKLDEKLDTADLTTISDRLTELEKQTAVFRAGGGMVLWKRPANTIPPGWSEVVDWRGRMPIGMDPDDVDFATLGGEAGNKSVALQVPLTGYVPGAVTDGGAAGVLIVSTGAEEIGEDFESVKKAATAPTAANTNIMNPYRIVMFIEYIYTAPIL